MPPPSHLPPAVLSSLSSPCLPRLGRFDRMVNLLSHWSIYRPNGQAGQPAPKRRAGGMRRVARTSIEEIRRRELTEAAYEILQEAGIAGTTLAKVAECAGMSKGIVLHYFRDKDDLLEAVMRLANALLRDEVVRR